LYPALSVYPVQLDELLILTTQSLCDAGVVSAVYLL
jgi:hypothetical protein